MAAAEGSLLTRRLSSTLAARLFLNTLLLSALLLLGARAREEEYFLLFTPRWILALITGTFAFIGVGAMGLRNGQEPRRIATAQIAWDILLTTGLIYISGAASSFFVILFGASTLMSALLLGVNATVTVSLVGASLYLLVGLSVGAGIVPPPPDQAASAVLLPARELGLRLITNTAMLGTVGALAANLSSRLREAGSQLDAAVARSEDLARLNEEIINTVGAGLIVTNPAGRLIALNPAGAQILGASAEALLGMELSRFLPVEPEHPVTRGEVVGRRLGGERFPAGFALSPLADDSSRGSLVTFQDLTEVRALEQQAEAAERLATLGRLAAGLAHELRNPLGAISGSVQLVRDSPSLDEEDRRLLELVVAEVHRLNGLVSTMLDVGRPRPPVRAPVDLAELARAVLEVARGDTPEHVELALELSEGADLVADVDADQLRQVIWNLIKNAVQASPAPPARSVVRVELAEEEGLISLAVLDEGPGIPEEDRARLFDAFFTKRAQGIGLGLALVQQITTAHLGAVEVREAPSGGACFRVILPKRASLPPHRVTEPREAGADGAQ